MTNHLPSGAGMSGGEPRAAPRHRAVLLDLDGTLLDSADLIMSAFEATLQANLHISIDRAEIRASWSRPIRERFRLFAPGQEEMLAQDYIQRYLALHDERARLFPGVPEVLETLRRRGYAMAIVTSKRRATTRAAIRRFALNRWCTVVVADEDVVRHKPYPDPIHAAAERLGLSAADTLMVGDSPLDIASGRSAGATTAAALWGTVEAPAVLAEIPDHRLAAPRDLLALCPTREGR